MYENQLNSNTAQNYTSGAQQTAGKVAEESRLKSAYHGLRNIGERAANLRTRIADMKDRALGGEPEGKQAGSAPRAIPNGCVAEIGQASDDVASIIEDCHSMMSRLETLV